MKHIPIDSYGACLQTAKIPEFSVRDVLRPYKVGDMARISSKNIILIFVAVVKFYLAFENSNCPQYVTEKFFNALHTG